MLRKLTSTSSSWAPVPLRLALGLIFIAHGCQLVFGSWSGPGLSKFASFPAPFSFMQPAWLWMDAAALSQLVGGAMVFLGLFTRLGALLLGAVMLTAMIGVHWSHGFFLQNEGVEFNVALGGMALALLITGGGQASLDRLIGGRK
jgi:putative oxidoreductase